MINDVLDLRRAAEPGVAAVGQHFIEKVTVIFFLRRRVNQAGISGRILRLEFADALEVSGIGDNSGELFDLFELVKIRVVFMILFGMRALIALAFLHVSFREPSWFALVSGL